MIVKRILHISAPEEIVLWANWRLFFDLSIIFFCFTDPYILNNINTLSSHKILINLKPNLILHL